MDTIIKINNASKNFKNKTVFKDITLDIQKGSSYGFIGYNGCGKSVFFKCICGFSRLSHGEIVSSGKKIGKDIDFIQNAGIVIESPSFFEDLSGYNNLRLIANIQKKITSADILQTLELLDLYQEKDKKVKAYSLGMKQKLRLAQAFMEKPDILILDEPTNGLDKQAVKNLYQLLQRFVQKGGTLLLSSHNKTDIQQCCERVYEFNNYQLEKI